MTVPFNRPTLNLAIPRWLGRSQCIISVDTPTISLCNSDQKYSSTTGQTGTVKMVGVIQQAIAYIRIVDVELPSDPTIYVWP